MDYYAGLDVSLEGTSVCVVDGDGAVVHEAKVATEVEAIAETLRRFARSLARVALEAGSPPAVVGTENHTGSIT